MRSGVTLAEKVPLQPVSKAGLKKTFLHDFCVDYISKTISNPNKWSFWQIVTFNEPEKAFFWWCAASNLNRFTELVAVFVA